jgi:hypothetical protein
MRATNKILVTEDELTVERTSDELFAWVQKKIQEIERIEGGKEAARMRKGYCKQLVEEIFPLSIFAKHVYSGKSHITFRPVIGNQNYDVLITDRSVSPPNISRLEITQAHEGEAEFLRRLLLQDQGWAPASGAIEKSGTKNTGIKLKASIEALDFEDVVADQVRLVTEAFERKLNRTFEQSTSLLIMFEDVYIFDDDRAIEKLRKLVEEEFAPTAFFKVVVASTVFTMPLPRPATPDAPGSA